MEGQQKIGLEAIMYGDKMKDLGLLGLGKRKQKDSLKAANNYVNGYYKISRVKLFWVVPSYVTEGNGHRLWLRGFVSDVRKTYSPEEKCRLEEIQRG